MSVVLIRLTKEEEKILSFLADYLDKDKTSVIKASLNDLYEDILDREEIKTYENLEKNGKAEFHSFEDILGTA